MMDAGMAKEKQGQRQRKKIQATLARVWGEDKPTSAEAWAMEEAAELGNYLPLFFKTRSEQDYVAFLRYSCPNGLEGYWQGCDSAVTRGNRASVIFLLTKYFNYVLLTQL
jgi:hypothetical protein